MGISQVIFCVAILLTSYWAFQQYSQIWKNINLGQDEKIDGQEGKRWKNVLLVAFGQKKMFKRMIPAVLHFFIYAAFLMTQVEFVEILIDGFFGVHRFFAPFLGGLYTFIISFIEILSVLAFVATFAFLARRNLLKIPRFHKSEMSGWPTIDANFILILEFFLIVGIFTMNGADVLLQKMDPLHYPDTGFLAISGWMGPLVLDGFGKDMLMLLERGGWWLHLIVVLFFINYLPKSKHLHIFLAFPNVYFAKLNSRGEMDNMPAIMNEVKSMMGLIPEDQMPPMSDELPEFGSKDVFDLSWKNILDAYSCTECGRCTDVCPANLTGKKLSPRKVMMDIRDRATEVGFNIETGAIEFMSADAKTKGEKLSKENYDDGKTLFDSISREELHACTTCNACVEACPIMIHPLEPILKLRRFEILTESGGPGDWLPMFTSIENSGSVWQVPDARDKWVSDLTNAE